MKIYKGTKSNRGIGGQDIIVTEKWEIVGGVSMDELRHTSYHLKHIVRHSPDGFNWGYGGSGAADTALSILTDCVGKDRAEALYQGFKERFVSIWGESFEVTENEIKLWVQSWVQRYEQQIKSKELPK